MRRLREADFLDAARRRQGGRHPAEWWVGEYEWRETTLVDATSRALQWQSYRPLEETKDLFLRFARLYELEDFAAGVKEWVDHHGLPNEFLYDGLFGEPDTFSSVLADRYRRALAHGEQDLIEASSGWVSGQDIA